MVGHTCREAFGMLINNQDIPEELFSASFFRFSFCINEMFNFESLSLPLKHTHTHTHTHRLVSQSSQ
jgi:hypothetical protein